MESSFSEHYAHFRENCLSVLEIENVRARLKTLLQDGRQGYIVTSLGPAARRFKLYVHISRKLNRISFLGCHFVRSGEPGSDFQAQLDEQLVEIAKEESHGPKN